MTATAGPALHLRRLPADAGGGWVDTHSDVTQQLVAEQERDALREREEQRATIDAQTASFRARVEPCSRPSAPAPWR